ncbi:MAG: TonB-dependent receptor [Bacteroidetes bacterium]|nr:TonB-dependent receptor [Bacteroidota bacterium]
MNKTKVLLVLVILFMTFSNCFSQIKTGSIKGTVVDEKGVPVSDCKVRLLSFSEMKVLETIVTDSTGKYFFTNLVTGRYNIRITNKEKKISNNFDVTIQDSLLNINTDSAVSPKTADKINTTEQIDVTSEKQVYEMFVDKNVYNVSHDNSLKGMNVIDALKKTPFVSVENMSILLKANPNIKFKLNDSPVNISGEQLYQFLLSMPAENVLAIEVYTNPGVKQSSEGTGGIINIVLKKEEEIPENKNINAGTYYYSTNSYNGFLGLGINEKNYDASLFYNYSRFNNSSNFDRKKIIYNPQYSEIFQSGITPSPSSTHYITLNADKSVLKKGNINFMGTFLSNTSNSDRTGQSSYYDILGNQTNKYSSENNSDTKFTSLELTSGLTTKIANEKNNLNVTASYKTDNIRNDFSGKQIYEPVYNRKDYMIKSGFQQDLKNFYFKPEFSTKFSKTLTFNTGGEFSGFKNKNENNVLNFDTTTNQFYYDNNLSNNFEYNRNIYSAYLETIANFSNLSLSAGLRMEKTNSDGNLVGTGNSFENNYTDFFPAFSLLKTINPNNSIRVSYSKRLNRPEAFYLNPFVNKNNVTLTVSTGNPYLSPEYSHTVELSYINSTGGININPTVFFKATNNVIAYVKSIIDSNITFSTYKNLNKTNSYGIDLSISGLFFKRAYLNGGISYYKSDLSGDVNSDINGNSISTLKANCSISIPVTLILSLDLYYLYQGKKLKPQGYTEPYQFLNAGISLRLMDSKLNIRLSANDIFNSQRLKAISDYEDSYEESLNKQNSQSIMLGINFMWGKIDNKKSKEPKSKKTKIPDTDLKESY